MKRDLFRVNIVDNPSCACGHYYDDIGHSFLELECKFHDVVRITLIDQLD